MNPVSPGDDAFSAPLRQSDPDFSLVNIPPRPALLMALQHEMRQVSPNTKKFAALIRRDVAMAGTLLQTANSAFFNVGRRITTIEDAIMLIGLEQCHTIMSGLILKKSLGFGNKMMARFWDVSEKRAIGIGVLAKGMRSIETDVAYSFGLFCDTGIPVMRAAFPSYLETLMLANRTAADDFLKVEEQEHGVNHTVIGSLLAQRWSLAPDVTQAILLHHSRDALRDRTIAPSVRSLVALNHIVEKAIQEYRGHTESLEWIQAGAAVMKALKVSEDDVDNMCGVLKARFRTY